MLEEEEEEERNKKKKEEGAYKCLLRPPRPIATSKHE
jgi:hypothetical protein